MPLTTKLQVTLDELEDSHDREKKSRLEVDKQRRKVDADLKVSQEKVTDLEREKHDIEAAIVKKDQDIVVSQRRLEDEQCKSPEGHQGAAVSDRDKRRGT